MCQIAINLNMGFDPIHKKHFSFLCVFTDTALLLKKLKAIKEK
jgi:hypothetical protein